MSRNPNIEQDESIEQLKRWWSSNGKYLVVGVVVGITAVISWTIWDNYQVQKLREASEHYYNLIELVENSSANLESKESTQEKTKLENSKHIHIIFSKFQNEYQSTPYAPLSALLVAKYYILQNDLNRGSEYLEISRQYATDQEIQFLENLAAIRLARVQWSQNKKDQALDTLSSTQFTLSFQAIADEMTADRLAAEGKKQEAFNLYNNSRKALSDSNNYIDMKIQRLGIRPTAEKNETK